MHFITTTRPGTVHESNEDTYWTHHNIAVLADGMGGENSGDIASKIAVETASSILQNSCLSSMDSDSIVQMLKGCVGEADKAIESYSINHPNTVGMGTTMVIALTKGDFLYVCWCGDSRCFVYNSSSNEITFTTKDHSYMQELIDKNKITIEQSYTHPDNNIITRYVGGGKDYAIPECRKYVLSEKDIVVLCSDGLSGYCDNETIVNTINKFQGNTNDLCVALESLALTHGSTDDITIIVSKNNDANSWKSWFSNILKH